jgi:hypothetical protein
MKTLTTSAKIYGDLTFKDEVQTVDIEYSGQRIGRHFNVDYLRVLTPLELEPSDLYEDLSMAISESEHTVIARIECEIELTELVRY